MEPATQALLGAATAELVAGKALRGRALGWGAVIGMSPDLDVLLGPLHDGYGAWIYHRGTTHAIWFGFVVGPVLGWLLWRWRDRGDEATLPDWIRISIVALVTHPLLDGFTPYGTQFFAPFLRDRYAWNGVAIVDPFYSAILAAGVLCAALRGRDPAWRRRALVAALTLSSAYLLIGLGVNRWVEQDLRRLFASRASTIERVRAYPTIFQPWLRSFVVRTPEAVFVGLHSWQQASCPVWRRYPVRLDEPPVRALLDTWEGSMIAWMADGDMVATVDTEPGGVQHVKIEDVRYAWASEAGRGMWGVEARLDAEGRLVERPRRTDRSRPRPDDLDRLVPLLLGRLPGAASWRRPDECGLSRVTSTR